MMFEPKVLVFTYCNWRGEVTVRHVHPLRVYFGVGEFIEAPAGEHWWMRSHDIDRGDTRDFRIAGMTDIIEEAPAPAAKGGTP